MGGTAWGISPTTQKIGPKNVDFEIFMQFLAILSNMSPSTSWPLMEIPQYDI